jgi:hypothetical protein
MCLLAKLLGKVKLFVLDKFVSEFDNRGGFKELEKTIRANNKKISITIDRIFRDLGLVY